MTFVVHLFGYELWRFTFGRLDEDTEMVSNTGGEFELPFGFASPVTDDEDED